MTSLVPYMGMPCFLQIGRSSVIFIASSLYRLCSNRSSALCPAFSTPGILCRSGDVRHPAEIPREGGCAAIDTVPQTKYQNMMTITHCICSRIK